MNFLNTAGLEYFYGKLKEKFIRSVNSYTPDENGNVTITNVSTADNLVSPDGQTTYSTFTYRTSGGNASISNGEAKLMYIDGNVEITGRVVESLTSSAENNIQSTCNVDTWRSQISTTGLYYFNYTRPSSGSQASSWNPSIGDWKYNNVIISLSTYGIEVSNIIAPSISITTTGADIRNPVIVPNTWLDAVNTDGNYVFEYTEDGWLLDDEDVLLNSYGISFSGTAEVNDQIIVNFQAGTPDSILTVSYIAPERGTINVTKPTSFKATGFNQFDKSTMYIQNAGITNGAIASNSGTYVAYCKAKGGVDNGYVAYSENAYIRNIGWCATLPTIGTSVVTTGSSVSNTLASIPFDDDGYVVVVATDISDLCIHPKWSGVADLEYEEYVAPDVITIPMYATDNTALPINNYGMPAVGNIADRYNLDAGIYIQNIGRYSYSVSNLETVQALGVDYDYDDTNIFYVLNTPVTYSVETDSTYVVNDFGTEEFLTNNATVSVGVKAYILYGQNLRDKLRTDVLTISAQNPPLTTSQIDQVANNLGFVKRSGGDTVTGALLFKNAGNTAEDNQGRIKLFNPDITLGQSHTKTILGEIMFGDSGNMFKGMVNGEILTTNTVRTSIQARNWNANDEAVTTSFRVGTNTSGGKFAELNGTLSMLDSTSIKFMQANMDYKNLPSSGTVTGTGIGMYDKNGYSIGAVYPFLRASGNSGIVLRGNVHNSSGTEIGNNNVTLEVNASTGAANVVLSAPAAWRTALSLESTSNFAPTSYHAKLATNAGTYKKFGPILILNYNLKQTGAVAKSATMMTFASGTSLAWDYGVIIKNNDVIGTCHSTNNTIVADVAIPWTSGTEYITVILTTSLT